MPRIPIYQQQVVANAPLSDHRFSGQAIRAISDNGLDNVARGLGNIVSAQAKEAIDRAETEGRVWAANASSQADLAMAEHMQQLQSTAQPGASGFTPGYLKDFDKYTDDVMRKAPSERARNMIQAHMAASREAFGRSALAFEAGERSRFMGKQVEDGIAASATITSANPAWFGREMGKWGSTIEGMQLPPAAKAALKEKAKQQLTNAAVVAWIDKNPAQAVKVIDGIMSGDDPAPSIEWTENGQTYRVPFSMGSVEERRRWANYAQGKQKEDSVKKFTGTMIDSAKAAVGAAELMAGDLVDLPSAKAQAVDIARSAMGDLTPEQSFQIEGYVERVAADRERDIKRRREAVMADAFARLDQNGGDYQAMLSDAPHIATQLNSDQLQRVNRYAGNVSTGGTRPTDWVAYGQLIDQPELLKNVNLGAIKDKFNAKEYAWLVKAQESLLNDPQAEQNLLSTTAVVNSLLKQAKITEDEKHKKFFSLLQQGINQELAASGKKSLPQKQIEEMAKDLLVKEITNRDPWFFGGDDTEEAFDINVPTSERLKIEASLISKGLPVNDLNVLNSYRKVLRRRLDQNNQSKQQAVIDNRIVQPSEFADVPPLLSSPPNEKARDVSADPMNPPVFPTF